MWGFHIAEWCPCGAVRIRPDQDGSGLCSSKAEFWARILVQILSYYCQSNDNNFIGMASLHLIRLTDKWTEWTNPGFYFSLHSHSHCPKVQCSIGKGRHDHLPSDDPLFPECIYILWDVLAFFLASY